MMNPLAVDYDAEMLAFRAKRENALKSEDGWLSTTGLTILEEGKNELTFGVVHVNGDTVLVAAKDGVRLERQGDVIRERKLRPDQDDDIIYQGRVSHQLIRRGDTLAIRTRDPESPLRKAFHGSEWFPINPAFRVSARAVPLERPRTRDLEYSVAARETVITDYLLTFNWGGVLYSLEPIIEPKRLFIPFRDLTNGTSTSPIGRYLYAPLPEQGRTVIDFNQACNPGSAYSDHVLWPVPPKRNTLYFHLDAGELAPKVP
jgi:uncharacterized protein (DUF1684 family)